MKWLLLLALVAWAQSGVSQTEETAPADEPGAAAEAVAGSAETAAEAEPATAAMPESGAAPAAGAEPSMEAATASGPDPAASSEEPVAQAPTGDTDVAAEILDETATADAAVAKLKAETKLLETISKGVTLSLAQCEGAADCEPAVNKAELERLVATVETRIEGLVRRQSESADAEIDDLLIAYAMVRDSYSQQLEKLGALAPEGEAAPAAEEGAFGEEAPVEETAESEPATPEEFSIFEDVDESVTDEPAADEGAEPDVEQ